MGSTRVDFAFRVSSEDQTLIEGETFLGTGFFTDPGADEWTGSVDGRIACRSLELGAPFLRLKRLVDRRVGNVIGVIAQRFLSDTENHVENRLLRIAGREKRADLGRFGPAARAHHV